MHAKCRLRPIAWLLCATVLGAAVELARAQDPASGTDPPDPRQAAAAEAAQHHVDDAVQAVQRMKEDPRIASLLEQAKGVLIVPRYTEGAAIIGGHGGIGVLLARRRDTWTDPVFYHVGGASIGLQAGGASGPIVMLLMSDKAVEKFRDNLSTWSLGGRAGLTVASFSGQKQHPTNSLDVIVWSGVKGLFGGASFSATDVTPDESADHAYYNSPVAPLQILVGAVTNPNARPLRNMLGAHAALE
jgi:SH3 domain-containing YSC84-like protein 1